jgi:proline racemase
MNRLTTIDVHVAGEPLRVVTSGFPEPSGQTILQKRRTCQKQFDHLRRALMWEPRGHADMYGCLLVTPSHPEADTGVLFFHNEGYSTMCGHGIIGVTTVMIETNLFPCSEPNTIIRFDTPSGLVTATASMEKGKVCSVSFHNVASFAAEIDQTIEVPEVGMVQYDLAFGGAFYAFCQAEALGSSLVPQNSQRLKTLGMAIKHAIIANRAIVHPTEPDLGFLYGTIFVGPAQSGEANVHQVCIFANGALDRSPTGTGVSAHLALLHAKGKLQVGESKQFESILGTQFSGLIAEETTIAKQPAIIPKIEGQAYITGKHEFLIDPHDPLREGFFLE